MNFTDLMNQLESEAKIAKENTEGKFSSGIMRSIEGRLDFIALVRRELKGVHIKPKTIYRAIAIATTENFFASNVGNESYRAGASDVAKILLAKAQRMDRTSSV